MPVMDARHISMLASPETIAYCRSARRVRHVHRDDPLRMHRELRALRPAGRDDVLGSPPRPDAGPAMGFACIVSESMSGKPGEGAEVTPVLTWATRQRLLGRARIMGIGRFEANLIIATVQHRAGLTRGRRRIDIHRAERDHASGAAMLRRFAPVALFAILQVLILVAAWVLLLM